MRTYYFICRRDRHNFELDFPDDLGARNWAKSMETCIRVETAEGRVVWRKTFEAPQTETKRRG